MTPRMRATLDCAIREHIKLEGGRTDKRVLTHLLDRAEETKGQDVPKSILWRALEIASDVSLLNPENF